MRLKWLKVFQLKGTTPWFERLSGGSVERTISAPENERNLNATRRSLCIN